MEVITECIEVAPRLEQRMKDIAILKGDNLPYERVALQSLQVVHLLDHARLVVFCEDQQLGIAPPTAIGLKPMHELKVIISIPKHKSLDRLCRLYEMDKQSILSWGLDCMQILQDAVMTGRLFYREERLEMKLPWIHKLPRL